MSIASTWPGLKKDVTPFKRISAQIENVSDRFPQEILVGLNNRDMRHHDVHRINIATGERKLVEKNSDFASFLSDEDYRVRTGHEDDNRRRHAVLPDQRPRRLEGVFEDSGSEDGLTTSSVGFDKTDPDTLHPDRQPWVRRRRLVQIDLSSGEEKKCWPRTILADVGADAC